MYDFNYLLNVVSPRYFTPGRAAVGFKTPLNKTYFLIGLRRDFFNKNATKSKIRLFWSSLSNFPAGHLLTSANRVLAFHPTHVQYDAVQLRFSPSRNPPPLTQPSRGVGLYLSCLLILKLVLYFFFHQLFSSLFSSLVRVCQFV